MHYSFSVWVLSLILLLGGGIMLTSMFMEQVLASKCMLSLFHRSSQFSYALAEWSAGSTLQLQRLAHENLGLGNWSKTNKDVPVTESGVKLAVLDTSNTRHVRMLRPSESMDELLVAEIDVNSRPGGSYISLSSFERT